MGMFSWKTSDTRKNIYRMKTPCYLLVPDEFGGEAIKEGDYDGYGHFGKDRLDVYDLVADWNKNYVTEDNLRKPTWEQYKNAETYVQAMKRYRKRCERLIDFQNGISDGAMREIYGPYYKRSIGIDIACYDEQNAALKYPIKIVEDGTLPYEKAKPSKSCQY